MMRACSLTFRFLAASLAIGLTAQSLRGADSPRKPQQDRAPRPAAFWTYQDFLDGKIPPKYSVRRGHPRLLITPDNKQEIVDKIRAAPKLWQQTIRKAEDVRAARGEWQQALACGMIRQLGLVPGFKYSMTREQYGRKGVELLMKLDFSRRQVMGGKAEHYAVPCAYDWLYDLLTAEQKQAVVAKMVGLIRTFGERKDYGPYKLPAVNGVDNQAFIIGLAFHGDGVDDAAAREIAEGAWKVMWDPEYSLRCVTDRARTVLYLIRKLEGGGNDEGTNYFTSHDTFPVHVGAWKTAAGVDAFAHMGYFRNLPYWYGFMSRVRGDGAPTCLICIHGYAWGQTSWVVGGSSVCACMAAATGYLRDVDPQGAALAHWWVQKKCGGMDKVRYLPMFIYGLLLGDPRVRPTPPRELKLPLTRVMRGLNYVFMRSDYWDNPDATVVAFGNGRYRYRSMPRNVFALYKNGAPLFQCRAHSVFHGYTPPGVVSDNRVVLYKGTAIHAEGLFLSPKEYDRSDFEKVAEVDSVPGEYDFMIGRRGRFRSHDGRIIRGIKAQSRTLVYLRPRGKSAQDHMVLLDRTDTSDRELTPHVVFNVVFEPRVGRDWQSETKGEPVHAGQWAVENAPCVTVTMDHEFKLKDEVVLRGHARAFMKTLWPKAIRTLKIGGLKHFMDDITGKGSLTHSPCQGFYKRSRASQIEAGGYWRFHVVPRQQSTTHTVLNVIEATDSKFDSPAGPLELLDGPSILGTRVGPNIVLFSKDGTELSSGSVKAAAAGTVRVLVADLRPETDYTLQAGKQALRLRSTGAGTAFAKRIEIKPGDVIKVGR